MPAYCRTCDCCALRREHDSVLRLHEFLGRLRPEFKQLRAQLLARSPLPSLVEAVTLARAEETRLRGVLSSSSAVLAATAALTSSAVAAALTSPPAVGSTAQGGTAAALLCRYCKSKTHTIEQCKKRPQRRKGGSTMGGAGGSSGASHQSPPEWVLDLSQRMERMERRLDLAAPSASSVVSSAATRLPQPGIQPPQSGTQPPWILDSGASFHMTHDSTHLRSLSPPSASLFVNTADGTSHSVLSHGTLRTPHFHVPSISHVPHLKLQLLSAGQITDHDCRIILESDSCSVQDHRTGILVGSGRRLRDPPRLWELDWLHLPLVSASSRCQSRSTADATAFSTTTAISFA